MDEQAWLPWIDPALCNGCGDCICACPTGALGLRDNKAAVVQPAACTYDARCEAACRRQAIALPYQVVLSVPKPPVVLPPADYHSDEEI